ncbi:MAG: hypothetical protein ACOC44_15860 [Promethearchaeia archaeon]
MKKIKLSPPGNDCQKNQNHKIAGWALNTIMRMYTIRYRFFASVLVVRAPSRTEAGIEIIYHFYFRFINLKP